MIDVHDIARMALLQYSGADNRYVPLEYLESTGGQYIDTGVGFSPTDELEMTGSSASLGNDSYLVAPSSWNTDSNRFSLLGAYNSYMRFSFGSATTLATPYLPQTAWDGTAVYTATYADRTFRCGELTGDATDITFGSDTTELYLFYGYNKPTPCRIYRYRHSKAGVLVRDLVPMLRIRDGKPGMYDRVHGRFYVNEGVGEFKYAYNARSYIQDGLVAMWDGIENAGFGVHDANATTWKNLGSKADADLVPAAGFSFQDNHVLCNGSNADGAWEAQSTTNNMGVWDPVMENSQCTETVCAVDSMPTVHSFAFWTGGAFVWVQRTTAATTGYAFRIRYCAKRSYPTAGYAYVLGDVANVQFSGGRLFVNGVETSSIGSSGGAADGYAYIGYGPSNQKDAKFAGRIYCVRIYDRTLTPDELAHNRAVDRLRFNLA